MRRGLARNALAIATWAFVAAVFVQVFLAGLGVFRSPTDFELHRNFGYGLEIIVLILGGVAAVLRVGKRIIGLALLIFALFLLQSILINFRTDLPMVAAFHPVNGFLILLASILLARETWRLGGLTEA
ncbi:MAG: DUF6220 domain-containing protein [Candidatus Limnocylindrales bacterium]